MLPFLTPNRKVAAVMSRGDFGFSDGLPDVQPPQKDQTNVHIRFPTARRNPL